jgi:hypothetical protein
MKECDAIYAHLAFQKMLSIEDELIDFRIDDAAKRVSSLRRKSGCDAKKFMSDQLRK